MNRITYLLLVAVAVYTITSVALAISTSDKCGGVDAPKHWIIAPPHWECGN